MAGFFSLGGGGRGNNQQPEQGHNPPTEFPPPDTLYWYKNEDVSSYRSLELWNQQQEQLIPQARPLHHPHQDLYSSAAALGVGPSRSSINVSDDQSSPRSAMMAMSASMGGGRGGISCQDCGNQAKKDCPHMRCRTCCKSRGFDCQTHIRSTWVPAPKRRERQQQLAALQQQREQQQLQLHGENPKRQRDNNPTTSALACTRLPGLEHENFPAVLNSPAEFHCVRVSSMDDADEQYAYQTAVNIGGHVFRGILYDQGPDYNYMAGESASAGVGGVQPLNLIAAAPSAESAFPTSATTMVSSTGPLVDPSSLYSSPAPLNTFMSGSGTQFFPHPRS